MDEQRLAARWRKRRIIYNNDGDDVVEARTGVEHNHDVAEALMTRKTGELIDDFLNARSTPLKGSQVDSNWYSTCMAGLTFSHNTKLGGFVGKGIPQELVDKYGRDSLQIQVDFSHENGMEAFWSLRMNDVHDSFPMGSTRWTYGLAPFKRDHPEYMMGTPEDWGKYPEEGPRQYWSHLDFSYPEVQDHIFSLIEEVAKNYDVDGITMELFKYYPYFRETLDWLPVEQRHLDMMTDLVRRVRKMADEVGHQRGRPLLLAVQTPFEVEAARFIGLDLEKWLAEDMIDLLMPGGARASVMTYSFSEIVKLGHKYNVPVYPCIGWGFWGNWAFLDMGAKKHRTFRLWFNSTFRKQGKQKENRSLITELNSWEFAPALWRGAAMNLFNAGADGIYIFNPALWQEAEGKHNIWRQIGDPATMANKDRIYGVNRFGDYSSLDKLEELELSQGEPVSLYFQVGEDVKSGDPSDLRFRIHLWDFSETNKIELKLNDVLLDNLLCESRSHPPLTGQWLYCKLKPDQIRRGRNTVQISVEVASKSSNTPIILDALQLHVKRGIK